MKVIMLLALLLLSSYHVLSQAAGDVCKNCNCKEAPWPPDCNRCCLKVSGKIVQADKEESTFTIRTQNGETKVAYNSSTAFTTHGKLVSADNVKDGSSVTVFGKSDKKGRIVAERIAVK